VHHGILGAGQREVHLGHSLFGERDSDKAIRRERFGERARERELMVQCLGFRVHHVVLGAGEREIHLGHRHVVPVCRPARTLNLRTTGLQKCAAVPRRARI